jgi:hypothetical protein
MVWRKCTLACDYTLEKRMAVSNAVIDDAERLPIAHIEIEVVHTTGDPVRRFEEGRGWCADLLHH